MTRVFVDTSGIYAFLVRGDDQHVRARAVMSELRAESANLLTSSYVFHETVALLQARIGLDAVRDLEREFRPILEIEWIEEGTHRAAMGALLAADRRRVSLADWSSFEIMRERRIERVFTFDEHFAEQGFMVIPAP